MPIDEAFPAITRRREPLAPYTHLRIGGPADYFVQPRTPEELRAVLVHCHREKTPLRMLGGGFNLLVRDDPVPGVVVRLSEPAFAAIEVHGTTLRAGGGAALFDVIAAAVQAKLSGLETLVGLRGSVGGSVRCNVGDRRGEIGAAVRRVCVLGHDAKESVRGKDELTFGLHSSDIDEPVILWVEFQLAKDGTAPLMKRMRRAWVARKAAEPMSFQSAVRLFRDPPGHSAAALIERSGLARTRVGGVEISDRNANYAVAHPGTTAKDVLQLLDTVRRKVEAEHRVALDQDLNVW